MPNICQICKTMSKYVKLMQNNVKLCEIMRNHLKICFSLLCRVAEGPEVVNFGLFQVDIQKTENVLLAPARARSSPPGVRKLGPIGGPDIGIFSRPFGSHKIYPCSSTLQKACKIRLPAHFPGPDIRST